jgi:hypothetical protein
MRRASPRRPVKLGTELKPRRSLDRPTQPAALRDRAFTWAKGGGRDRDKQDGKVRQRVIASLGQESTIAGALAVERYWLRRWQQHPYPHLFRKGDLESRIERNEHMIEILEYWQRREPFATRAGRSANKGHRSGTFVGTTENLRE